jgi:LPXTG-motif cell wall-anchored protein
MAIQDSVLPTYIPEVAYNSGFYYEELPVRLTYQVGLTADSEKQVMDLAKTGGELTFYTNDFGYTDKVDNQGNHVTVVEPYTSAVLNPSLGNPFYHDQVQADGTTQKAQYKPHHDDKDENTTDTADFHVDCQLASEVIDETTVWEVTHVLGNNGKLVFSVESVDIPVEKTWVSTTASEQDPVELALYVVKRSESGDNYIGSVVEGKTLTLSHSTDSAVAWKGTFEKLPKLPDGQFYAVAETVPNGFVVSYGDNEITMILQNGAQPVQAALVTDYSDENVAATVQITNAPRVTLPETGGVGTTLYTTGGLLLMMAAILLLLHNQKNKRRKGGEPSC